jgi:hypothetical protein
MTARLRAVIGDPLRMSDARAHALNRGLTFDGWLRADPGGRLKIRPDVLPGIYKSDGFQHASCRNCPMTAESVWKVTESVAPLHVAPATRFSNLRGLWRL